MLNIIENKLTWLTVRTHEGLRLVCFEKEALFFSYHDTKGEISIATGSYHIRLKTAHPHLPSSEQVFLDLPLLRFAYSKRFLATPKPKRTEYEVSHLDI